MQIEGTHFEAWSCQWLIKAPDTSTRITNNIPHNVHQLRKTGFVQVLPHVPGYKLSATYCIYMYILLLAHFVLLVSPDWPSVVSLWSAAFSHTGITNIASACWQTLKGMESSNWRQMCKLELESLRCACLRIGSDSAKLIYIYRERELFLHVPFWTAQAIPLQQSGTGTNPEMHQLLHLLIMSWKNVSVWKAVTSSLEEAVTFKARSHLSKQEWAAWALSRQVSAEVTPSKILISAPPMWWQQRCSNKHEVWPCNCFAPSSVIIVECSSCGNDARTWKGGGAENSKTVWTWNLLNWKWLWLWWLEQWVQVFSLHVLRTKPCWVKQGNQSWHKAAWNKSGNKRIALHDGFHPLPTVCVAERAWRRSCCKTLAASFGCRYIPCRGKKKGWKESYSRTWSTHKCRSLN